MPCNGQAVCLAKLVDKLGQDLATTIVAFESRQDSAQAAALEQSQQSWERYKQDACAALTDGTKQVRCETSLTLSRLGNCNKIY